MTARRVKHETDLKMPLQKLCQLHSG